MGTLIPGNHSRQEAGSVALVSVALVPVPGTDVSGVVAPFMYAL